ncbi:hypothetical protein TARUN_3036 [Trichoderma arundinaceum]|uniref:Uncharacterized protein n=1 Tax=Trichoderma arundinaceum TaxID=490622 RepID=A0A395NSX2_TRIAR|nr:hypothetical protein TARUN_3036 [Trichoderma arundinaceum]
MSAVTFETTERGISLEVNQETFALRLTREGLTPDPLSLVVISEKPKLELQICGKSTSVPGNATATNEYVNRTDGDPMDVDSHQWLDTSARLRPEPLYTQWDDGNHSMQSTATAATAATATAAIDATATAAIDATAIAATAATAAMVHVGGDAPRSFAAMQGNGTVSFWA